MGVKRVRYLFVLAQCRCMDCPTTDVIQINYYFAGRSQFIVSRPGWLERTHIWRKRKLPIAICAIDKNAVVCNTYDPAVKL